VAHLGMLRSIPDNVLNFWIFLFVIAFILCIMATESSVYATVISCDLEVRNVYPFWSLCSHLSSHSKKKYK
jgi:hypothetical protein